jgi:hypothetical protein
VIWKSMCVPAGVGEIVDISTIAMARFDVGTAGQRPVSSG